MSSFFKTTGLAGMYRVDVYPQVFTNILGKFRLPGLCFSHEETLPQIGLRFYLLPRSRPRSAFDGQSSETVSFTNKLQPGRWCHRVCGDGLSLFKSLTQDLPNASQSPRDVTHDCADVCFNSVLNCCVLFNRKRKYYARYVNIRKLTSKL